MQYTYTWPWREYSNPAFIVVGCGGTGSLVAEGLCRLLHGQNARLYLIDYDRVEQSNLQRQNFYIEDLGHFKSEVLAKRLSRMYGRMVGYSVHPFSSSTLSELYRDGLSYIEPSIIIGCVDNPEARRAIHDDLAKSQRPRLWIDAGNGEYSGQVLVGDTSTSLVMEGVFRGNACLRLPAPTLQEPGLLMSVAETQEPNCAVAVEQGDQSPVINSMMAGLVLDLVNRALLQRLTWMGVYIDLEVGHLRPVPITPEGISRITQVPEKKLVGG